MRGKRIIQADFSPNMNVTIKVCFVGAKMMISSSTMATVIEPLKKWFRFVVGSTPHLQYEASLRVCSTVLL